MLGHVTTPFLSRFRCLLLETFYIALVLSRVYRAMNVFVPTCVELEINLAVLICQLPSAQIHFHGLGVSFMFGFIEHL